MKMGTKNTMCEAALAGVGMWAWLLIAAVPLAHAAATPSPQAQTTALVEGFKKIRVPADNEKLSDADRRANQAAFAGLDAFFAYDTLCRNAIAPHRAALSKAQLERYSRTFRELLRLVSYRRSGQFVQQAQVRLDEPKVRDGLARVDMHASLGDDDTQTDVTFVWQQTAGGWRIVDVSFDGVSFVKDYQNQFGKMLKKYGAEGFLQKLSDRLAQEQNE
ncbi:MAG: ABC transporter substrate-binding protein [Deltaproteobacteria bacterium]|nr:MAG: ABC transporter substrate-binding protein [Deltaproteobacteria bacterium]